MQVKLLLVTFYLNRRLHAVSIGKPSERTSKFLDGLVFKNRISILCTSLHYTTQQTAAISLAHPIPGLPNGEKPHDPMIISFDSMKADGRTRHLSLRRAASSIARQKWQIFEESHSLLYSD